ncbi:hypothetical protein RJ639_039868 [Escallonia herrerae]|uniref:tRNA dimethylallyltransferase n=1 Tax=Escallonia herrerae TaxID=1293975 RepID=A0AA89B6W9_9ASTE|nr:hypothetical protein RJ639_039868 [Escallonia herrerae]
MISGIRLCCLRLPYEAASAAVLPRPSTISFRRRPTFATSCSASAGGKKEKVIVISGPTGAGKSRLALELAKRLNGEIISADSVQVYRGLDVGSAKPSLSERNEVPHHLLDILHPSEEYSVGKFYEEARSATRDILSRGRVPIVTGGTGLFIYGKPDVPKATPEITSEVNSELAGLQRDDDWDAAVQLVVKAGDPSAESLAANDWYRLRRRLEIIKKASRNFAKRQLTWFRNEHIYHWIDASRPLSITWAEKGQSRQLAQHLYAEKEKEKCLCFFYHDG